MASSSLHHPSPKPPDILNDVSMELRNPISTSDMAAAQNPSLKPPSYASMVLGTSSQANDLNRPTLKPRFPPLSLPTRQVGSKDGRPAISFTGAEVGACEKRFEFSIIAKFTVGRPRISEILTALQESWPIVGRITISEIFDGRHVLIILDSEADVRTALSSSLHKIGHALFRLFRWSPSYNPKKESKFATIWVRLRGLPLGLYDTAFVEAIVSTFGYFVAVDARTKACVAVNYARACVELDVTQPIPDSIWISLPNDKGFWQPIETESNLRYCSKCRVHGHTISTCRKSKVPQPHTKNQETHRPIPNRNTITREVSLGRSKSVSVTLSNKQKEGSTIDPSARTESRAGEEWVPVVSKKGKKKGVKTGTNDSADLENKSLTPDPLAMVVYSGGQLTEDQTNTQETTMQIGTSRPSSSSPTVPQPRKVPNDLSGAELRLKSNRATSAEVFLDESLNVHVHPMGIDRFNQIQEKAGKSHIIASVSSDQKPSGSTSPVLKDKDERKLSERVKDCINQGSKHCPPTVSQ